MKKQLTGIVALIIVIALGLAANYFIFNNGTAKGTEIIGAVGGGKENLLADEVFNQILAEDFSINVTNEAWSNSKLIVEPLDSYDFVFFSDQRFFEYYKLPANSNEAPRRTALKTSIALNTPIVIYSWDEVCDALIKQNIVEEIEGVYYITDMPKLLDYIVSGKKWEEIGLDDIYGKINIGSTDPVTSSPGATYYGLLASVMKGENIDENNIYDVLPALKEFYNYSGYMNNTPADLFELYLRTGMGAKPMIVDYEKSIIDFVNNNPEGFSEIASKIRILYPKPTIWNSHPIMAFTENGVKFVDALNSPQVQDLAFKKYGFRTGLTGGRYKVSDIAVKQIPQEIQSVVQPLKKEVYDIIIEYLKNE